MARPKRHETKKQKRLRMSENTRRWRARHPEEIKRVRKKQYNSRKLRAMNLAGGAKCIRCGCDEFSFLEFNHKNGGGCKDWRESGGVAMVDRILTGKRNTDDLEIVCRVCNALDFLERKNNQSAKRFQIKWM